MDLVGKRVLLIVSGGIAAYKALELVRRLRDQGAAVRCVTTRAAERFVTTFSLQALSEHTVYRNLFSLTDESEMGHIRLSREADLLLVAPATADLLAKMAVGLADDLASTVLLATDTPVLVAPSMNVRMWLHPATRDNLALLERRGVHRVGPEDGAMACGEFGPGRMAEPAAIVAAVTRLLDGQSAPTGGLAGKRALVTSGPTQEPIDPVRFIANRSSGRQGHAIAAALAGCGARVKLVSGPVRIPDPPGVDVERVETAEEMLAACRSALPVDVAVCAAAVADWRVATVSEQKVKKGESGPPTLTLVENPDILASLGLEPIGGIGPRRPTLVVGFAAETESVIAHARRKRERKGVDWILANDVSPQTGTFGGDENTVHLVTAEGVETWPRLLKTTVAARLAARIATYLQVKDEEKMT